MPSILLHTLPIRVLLLHLLCQLFGFLAQVELRLEGVLAVELGLDGVPGMQGRAQNESAERAITV
jgi:hypothetical protein